MNTHSQQPNGNITPHSRGQVHLNIQVQLNTNIQAALVALGVLLLLNLVESLAGTDWWDSTSAGNACGGSSNGGHEVLTAAWESALCVVQDVGGTRMGVNDGDSRWRCANPTA